MSQPLISYFAEGFIEQSHTFVDVGLGDIEHRGEAKNVA
jgi:hypothetical protein